MNKRWIDLLTVLYGLFLVYSSGVPFDFSSHAPSDARGQFLGVHITDVSLPDIMSNVAIYLPLGLLLRSAFGRRRLSPVVAALSALCVASALSFVMEWLQTLLVSRVSSIADCACNVLGAAVGVLLYTPNSVLARRMEAAIRVELCKDTTGLHVGLWGLLITAAALVPLDLALDRSLLAHAARDAYFVPFAKGARLVELAEPYSVEPFSVYNRAAIDLWHLRIDYVVDVLLFAVLAVLVARRWRARGSGLVESAFRATAVATATAILVTAAGLFVMSVGFDMTRVLTRALGGALGALLFGAVSAVGAHRRLRSGADSGRRYRGMLIGVVATCLFYIGVRQLVPFHFTADASVADPQRIEWLPFHMYTMAKLPAAALDALQKSFRFLVFGAAVAMLRTGRKKPVGWGLAIGVGGCMAAFVAGLEVLQYWLPGRVPSVTDVLLAWTVTALGVVGARSVYGHFRQLVTRYSEGAAERVVLNVELPAPGDAGAKEAVTGRVHSRPD
jgi:VanZ family protein